MKNQKGSIKILLIILLVILIIVGYFSFKVDNPKKEIIKSPEEVKTEEENLVKEKEVSEKPKEVEDSKKVLESNNDKYGRYTSKDCKIVSGCNGPISCVDKDMEIGGSICVALPEFGCYIDSSLRCEKQVSGMCDWTETPKLKSCVEDARQKSINNNINNDPQSSMVVISPNGGETYKVGDKINIRWNYSNLLSRSFSICLYTDKEGCFYTISNNIPFGTNNFDWTIDNSILSGNYKITVGGTVGFDGSVYDRSDDFFAITN